MRIKSPATISRTVVLVVLLCSFLCVASPICSHNEECDDSDPDTYDFCWKVFSECYSISKTGNQSKAFVPTTLEDIIKETNAKPLSVAEKRQIVSAASVVMEELNPHRFLQLNLLKLDIVAEFTGYLHSPALQNDTNFEFHETMKRNFQKMNDLHTSYFAPGNSLAILGFRVEEFFEQGDVDKMGKPRPRFVVADIVPGLAPENLEFGVGAELLKWNGEDIGEVVRKLGEEGYGSNNAAQMSRAVTELTFRFNDVDRVPLDRTVKIHFRGVDGTKSTAVATWFFAAETQGIEIATSRATKIWQMGAWKMVHADIGNLDLSHVVHETNLSTSTSVRCGNRKATSIAVKPGFEELFQVEIIQTDSSGEIGRIMLPSFQSIPSEELVGEFIRILNLMPKTGLILDARRNVGGSPSYAAALSILASGKSVDPTVTTIRSSDLMFQLVSNVVNSTNGEVGGTFQAALETAVRVGENFTGPILGPASQETSSVLALIPRAYFGPVVSVVNGETYSAGDYFAAIQVDQNMSTLVGTSDNVGAGGASVMAYQVLASFSSDLPALPDGVTFSTAFERFYRSGPNSGALIENFGVQPQVRYYPTLRDALEGDCDLFEFLGRHLAAKAPP